MLAASAALRRDTVTFYGKERSISDKRIGSTLAHDYDVIEVPGLELDPAVTAIDIVMYKFVKTSNLHQN